MFAFLAPLAVSLGRDLLGSVIKRVLKAEGTGSGEAKRAVVVEAVGREFGIEPGEIVRLVNAVVALLNVIGLFDDKPGLDFSDIGGIFVAAKEVVEAVADLID